MLDALIDSICGLMTWCNVKRPANDDRIAGNTSSIFAPWQLEAPLGVYENPQIDTKSRNTHASKTYYIHNGFPLLYTLLHFLTVVIREIHYVKPYISKLLHQVRGF